MGVWCEILVRKPSNGVYFAGTVVRGVVEYAVDQPIEFRDIIVSLVGSGKCEWTETETIGKDRREITYTGNEEYVRQYKSLIDKQKDIKICLQPGRYQTPFDFVLPYGIPSSYKDHRSSIKYRIKVKFLTTQFFKLNKNYQVEFQVSGYVATPATGERTGFSIEKKLFKPFSKKDHIINLTGDINSTFFNPNQTADLNFLVTNDSSVQLNSVKTELIEYRSYTANCGRRKCSSNLISGTQSKTPSVPKDAIANMSTTVPISPYIYTLQNSRIISVEYRLRVTLKLPVPYRNESFEIPIEIGYKHNSVVVIVTDISNDEPPTYWQAVGEDNESKDIDYTDLASGSKDEKYEIDFEKT